MNVVVHSIMYGYYWWRSVGGTTPPGFSKYITLGQTLQMVVGVWACIVVMQNCDRNWYGNRAALAMYFSYFVLFWRLLVQPEKPQNRKRK